MEMCSGRRAGIKKRDMGIDVIITPIGAEYGGYLAEMQELCQQFSLKFNLQ
jgi:hypothetical protein